MVGLPGSAQWSMPPGEDWLVREVQDLRRQVAEMTAAFTRIGLIGDNALAKPVAASTGTGNTGGPGVNLTLTPTDYAPCVFTVPEGFTTALVLASANCYYLAVNPLKLQVNIAGDLGFLMTLGPSADPASGSAGHAAPLSGLVGGESFTIHARAYATGPSTAFVNLNTTASAFFLR